MVRLKARRRCLPIRTVHISIPHGTIKSAKNLADVFSDEVFQFHMVRLKVSSKARETKCSFISIPHGTIKS